MRQSVPTSPATAPTRKPNPPAVGQWTHHDYHHEHHCHDRRCHEDDKQSTHTNKHTVIHTIILARNQTPFSVRRSNKQTNKHVKKEPKRTPHVLPYAYNICHPFPPPSNPIRTNTRRTFSSSPFLGFGGPAAVTQGPLCSACLRLFLSAAVYTHHDATRRIIGPVCNVTRGGTRQYFTQDQHTPLTNFEASVVRQRRGVRTLNKHQP